MATVVVKANRDVIDSVFVAVHAQFAEIDVDRVMCNI